MARASPAHDSELGYNSARAPRSFPSASELLAEAFPFHTGVCPVGLLAGLPSRVSFSLGEGHPGILADLLVELGCLVAKEGQIFGTSPVANQGPVPEGGASGSHAGLADQGLGSRRSMDGTCDKSLQLCPDFPEDLDGVGVVQPIFLRSFLGERNIKG